MIFVTGCMSKLIMKIDTLHQQQISYEEDYNANNDHWVRVDESNRIQLIFTIPARIENFSYDDLPLKNIGYVNEQAFSTIKKCILSKGAACFIDIPEQEIHYHRLVLLTDFENLENVPEKFSLSVKCIDDNNNEVCVEHIKIEKSKKFKRKLRFKATEMYTGVYDVVLRDPGSYDFKISGEVRGARLKCYLNCHRM